MRVRMERSLEKCQLLTRKTPVEHARRGQCTGRLDSGRGCGVGGLRSIPAIVA